MGAMNDFRFDGAAAKKRRYVLGKKVADVAAEVGVSESWVYRIERSEFTPGPDKYGALMRELGLEPGDLLISRDSAA